MVNNKIAKLNKPGSNTVNTAVPLKGFESV